MKNRDYKNFRAPMDNRDMMLVLSIVASAISAIALVVAVASALDEPDSQPGHDTETISVCELVVHQDDLP